MYKEIKPMLDAEELINHLNEKGVKFELTSMEDAKKYLEMAEQLEPKNQEIAEHLRILMVDGENKNEN